MLVRFYKEAFPETETDIWLRRMMSRMTEDVFDLLLAFWEVLRPQEAGQVLVLRKRTEELRKRGDCVRLKQMAVTGTDLMAAGVPKGPVLGETLQALFELVLEHPEWNEKEVLLEKLSDIQAV